jgi:hypothetical protein
MVATIKYLLVGQISLFLFLFICFLLTPHFLLESNEGGVSNYGLYARTVVPYTLAFGICGLSTLQSVRFIPRGVAAFKFLKSALSWLGIIYLLVLFSTYPYKVNDIFNHIHIYIAAILFVSQIILSLWFVMIFARTLINLVILAIQFLSFILATLNFFGYVHLLFAVELLSSLAFGILLVRTTAKLQAAALDTSIPRKQK